MKLILARPEHAAAISKFYAANHTQDFAHQEVFDPGTVRSMLQDVQLSVVMAADGEEIVGCGLAFPREWNQSLEIGTLSVADVPERGLVGKALFEALRRLGLKHYGMAVFRATTEGAFKRSRSTGALCWGYWPKPGSMRMSEGELVMGIFNDKSNPPRSIPPKNDITTLSFATRIIEAYPDGQQGVPYPKNFPVGAPRGTGVPVISGHIWPTYRTRGNSLTIENTAGPYPSDIIREFVGKVRQKGVSDVRLMLPVNQVEAYFDLIAFGFKPVAYLPGWFIRGAYRFDCVEMVSGLPRVVHGESFMERAIRKIDDGFRA